MEYTAERQTKIVEQLMALNRAQNDSALKQDYNTYRNHTLYENAELQINYQEIYDFTRLKGALTFVLYAYLLAPVQVANGFYDTMYKLGEVYQLADDISDIEDDTKGDIITPPALALIAKPGRMYLYPHLLSNPFAQGHVTRAAKAFGLRTKAISPTEMPYYNVVDTRQKIDSVAFGHLTNYIEGDFNNFYQYCYYTLAEIEALFTRLKGVHAGLPSFILDNLQRLMVGYIAEGYSFIERKEQASGAPLDG